MNDFQFRRGDVKRPGAPQAIAGAAADDFRQDLPGIAAFGDHMAVVAVSAKDVIVSSQRFADRNAGGFLSDIDMKVTANETLVVFVEANDVLFGAPDHQHLAQNAELPLAWNIR